MPEMESILSLPGFEVRSVEGHNPVVIKARYTGRVRALHQKTGQSPQLGLEVE